MPSRTSILALVPDAEPVVGHLRETHDPAAFAGIGAHITLLFPFAHASQIDDALVQTIADHFARCAHGPLDLQFDRVERFPALAYLALANPSPTIAVMRALQKRWPEYPLYEGKFPEAVPHLTVAHGDADVLDTVEGELVLELPLRARITHVSLFVESDGTPSFWREHARFAL